MNNCRFDDTDHSQVLIHEEWPVVWHQPKCHSASSHHWSKASLGRGYQGTRPSHPQFRLSTAAIFCPVLALYPLYPKNGLNIFRALPSACAARSSALSPGWTSDNSCSEIERDAQITESTWNQPWNQPWNQLTMKPTMLLASEDAHHCALLVMGSGFTAGAACVFQVCWHLQGTEVTGWQVNLLILPQGHKCQGFPFWQGVQLDGIIQTIIGIYKISHITSCHNCQLEFFAEVQLCFLFTQSWSGPSKLVSLASSGRN